MPQQHGSQLPHAAATRAARPVQPHLTPLHTPAHLIPSGPGAACSPQRCAHASSSWRRQRLGRSGRCRHRRRRTGWLGTAPQAAEGKGRGAGCSQQGPWRQTPHPQVARSMRQIGECCIAAPPPSWPPAARRGSAGSGCCPGACSACWPGRGPQAGPAPAGQAGDGHSGVCQLLLCPQRAPGSCGAPHATAPGPAGPPCPPAPAFREPCRSNEEKQEEHAISTAKHAQQIRPQNQPQNRPAAAGPFHPPPAR